MPEDRKSKLITTNQFSDPEAAFRALVEAHRGLTAEQSADLNAQLVLLLANHIGDVAVLRDALALARLSSEEKAK
jgi:hypothetical protein